jgi:peptidoglycan L-alanyl-D-glutamate endopeptidase CwlK
MAFTLSKRSRKALEGVHPDLVRVVERAIQITPVDFVVTEGLRSPARQRQLVAAGASQITRSRHITGHAVDVAALVGREVRWEFELYRRIAAAFQRAADEFGVSISWRTLRDGPHFELSRKAYPA